MKEPDPFKAIADRAHFNIYHSDLWRGTGKRFAEYIVEHCAQLCGSQADRRTYGNNPTGDQIIDHGCPTRAENFNSLNQPWSI